MSHMAMVRSSTRMGQQRVPDKESQQQKDGYSQIEQTVDQLSQMSIISVSSNEAGEIADEMAIRRARGQRPQSKLVTSTSNNSNPKPLVAPLEELKTVADIDSCVDVELNNLIVLDGLENKWRDIMLNLQNVLDHLQACGNEVTMASNRCLETAVGSIETTCDNVDNELKTMYHLMTKCDELTTKLSAATSFRDEIKTLRKSVDTLEQLYQRAPQKVQPNRSPLSDT